MGPGTKRLWFEYWDVRLRLMEVGLGSEIKA